MDVFKGVKTKQRTVVQNKVILRHKAKIDFFHWALRLFHGQGRYLGHTEWSIKVTGTLYLFPQVLVIDHWRPFSRKNGNFTIVVERRNFLSLAMIFVKMTYDPCTRWQTELLRLKKKFFEKKIFWKKIHERKKNLKKGSTLKKLTLQKIERRRTVWHLHFFVAQT